MPLPAKATRRSPSSSRRTAQVARVESYRGFVFGSHAPGGPGLTRTLGAAGERIRQHAPRPRARRHAVSAIGALRLEVPRQLGRCSWKTRSTWCLHPGFAHRSSVERRRAQPQALAADGLTRQGRADVPRQRHARAASGTRRCTLCPAGHACMGGFYKGGGSAPSATIRRSRTTESSCWSSATARKRPPPCCEAVDRFHRQSRGGRTYPSMPGSPRCE